MKPGTLLLLSFALILSSIIRLRFSLYDGFELHGFWITLPITFFSYSSKLTPYLTTTFIGYLLFILFGIYEYKKTEKGSTRYRLLTLFILFSAAATSYEISQIISDYRGHYHGLHFHCGPLLFLASLSLLQKE